MFDDYHVVPELDEEYAAQIAAGYYDLHAEQAINEFIYERLQSFYLQNNEVIASPLASLSRARELVGLNQNAAALVFAVTAIEVGLKLGFIKAIVYGSVHSETAAGIIADMSYSHAGFERLRDLVFQILSEVNLDLRAYRRANADSTLWQEIIEVQQRRNAIVHRAQDGTEEEAQSAIAIASSLLEDIFPAVIANIGLHLHDGRRVCGNNECRPVV
jgi:hypothetical protein